MSQTGSGSGNVMTIEAAAMQQDLLIIEKEKLRRKMLNLRRTLSDEQAEEESKKIMQLLLTSKVYQKADQILCFVSCRKEPDTVPFIEQALADGKKVAVPKVTGPASMIFLQIRSLDELRPGYFGVREPVCTDGTVLSEGLVITPGLAFDRQMRRLGYGGGYYDAWLAGHRKGVISCGIAYDFQLVDRVPAGRADMCTDMLVTAGALLLKRA